MHETRGRKTAMAFMFSKQFPLLIIGFNYACILLDIGNIEKSVISPAYLLNLIRVTIV